MSKLVLSLSLLSCSILLADVALASDATPAQKRAKVAQADDDRVDARRAETAPMRSGAKDSPVVAAVKKELIKPLALKDASRSKYSRVPSPPADRQVRVPDAAPKTDKNGKQFVNFVVDAKQWDEWNRAAMSGCVYPDSGEVFVKRGDGFRPAAQFVGAGGKKVSNKDDADVPADGVCVPAATVASRS
jgi:hypothetical protein